MISIAMAYCNRKRIFVETLKSIARSKYKDIEVVAVDDNSDESERIDELPEQFPFMRVIRVNKEDKWYISGCMPWNRAIANCRGDIILLQNPECLHVHDVLDYVKDIKDTDYVTMSVYSINKELTEKLPEVISDEQLMEFFKVLPQQHVENYVGWYNHSVHNVTYFPFCAAMTRKNMDAIGGFDERFATGVGFEDNDLINRIDRLGLKKTIVDDVSVIHQWHPIVYNMTNQRHLSYWYLNSFGYQVIQGETLIKAKNRYR